MLFDSHGHIQFPVYDNYREEVIKRARQAGVKMICVGTQAATSKLAIKVAEQYSKDIWATVGFHPNHLSDAWYHDKKEQKKAERENFDVVTLKKLAEHPKVVAIGECGLDYYRLDAMPIGRQAIPIGRQAMPTGRQENREAQIVRQKEVFAAQIQLAESLKKPLMMHTRPSLGADDAYEDTLEILNQIPISIPMVNHFYVGSFTVTKKLLEKGVYFTFGGVITFSRDYDDILNYIPLDRILLETDAPYVAPEPYRGQRNEPSYIVATAKKLAEIRGDSYEKVAETTFRNTLTVFKISL